MSYLSEYDALDDPAKQPEALESQPHPHARFVPDTIWLVLARRAYDQPLQQVGTVEADDRNMAVVYARSIYDEFAWVEMALVRRNDMVTAIES
jgi:1,2-phenylacetyl-CoA epoxidase PaaB subunit